MFGSTATRRLKRAHASASRRCNDRNRGLPSSADGAATGSTAITVVAADASKVAWYAQRRLSLSYSVVQTS
jgi:hypothetical protein